MVNNDNDNRRFKVYKLIICLWFGLFDRGFGGLKFVYNAILTVMFTFVKMYLI